MIDELKSVNETAHALLRHLIKEGDTVVDATCGNGYDSVFAARLVGEKGRVYAFDVQPLAIENTVQRLKDEGLSERVAVIEDDHSRMRLYLHRPVNAFIFNLGYLPGSDHSTVTHAETTIKALETALEFLAPGGMIVITVYLHDEGVKESEALESFLKNLTDSYNAYSLKRINRTSPPFLYIVTRDEL